MSPTTLKEYTCKDLAQMARKKGVSGWHSMRKGQLIQAILKAAKKRGPADRLGGAAEAAKKQGDRAAAAGKGRTRTRAATARVRQRITQLQNKLDEIKNLATTADNGHVPEPVTDRLIVMVRDPFWLHVVWELSPKSVQRARAAMGQQWHAARPVLRLLREGTGESTVLERTIAIHGSVSNWYIDVKDPPTSYRVEIGYMSASGEFHRIARSNTVTTPRARLREAIEERWSDLVENAERIYAMSGGYSARGSNYELQELLEERLGRPVGSPMEARFGAGAHSALVPSDDFGLAVDVEMIVYGATQRDAHVTLNGEPVRLSPDGTFTVRLDMPDRRQVLPVVASTHDGVEQRTVSIAVERNTKVMEPVIRQPGD